MANPPGPSKFEQMVTNNTPVQTSLIKNLTRWDFRNLQLAGVKIPVSREFQRKHLVPNRCDEWDPEKPERCANTTESFDEIKACAGQPMRYKNQDLAESIWVQKTQPCLQNQILGFDKSGLDNEPNTGKYPIHTKVCRRCHDNFAARELDRQLRYTNDIASLRLAFCKQHKIQLTDQYPRNSCRCRGFVNDKWRCIRCYTDTLVFLNARANAIRSSLTRATIPWYQQPWAFFSSLFWEPDHLEPGCPIKGCTQEPIYDDVNDDPRLCMGCSSIVMV